MVHHDESVVCSPLRSARDVRAAPGRPAGQQTSIVMLMRLMAGHPSRVTARVQLTSRPVRQYCTARRRAQRSIGGDDHALKCRALLLLLRDYPGSRHRDMVARFDCWTLPKIRERDCNSLDEMTIAALRLTVVLAALGGVAALDGPRSGAAVAVDCGIRVGHRLQARHLPARPLLGGVCNSPKPS